jgi:hypothetical protein
MSIGCDDESLAHQRQHGGGGGENQDFLSSGSINDLFSFGGWCSWANAFVADSSLLAMLPCGVGEVSLYQGSLAMGRDIGK